MVRRCVHRHTGQELAVKIIEITAEKMTAQQLAEVKTSTLKEIQVLNMVKGHASISTFHNALFTRASPRFKSNDAMWSFPPFSNSDRFLRIHHLHIFSL